MRCIDVTSIKSVLPSKAGLPTEEENPRWLGAGERFFPASMRWSIGSTGKQSSLGAFKETTT